MRTEVRDGFQLVELSETLFLVEDNDPTFPVSHADADTFCQQWNTQFPGIAFEAVDKSNRQYSAYLAEGLGTTSQNQNMKYLLSRSTSEPLGTLIPLSITQPDWASKTSAGVSGKYPIRVKIQIPPNFVASCL